MTKLNKEVGYTVGQRVLLVEPEIEGTIQSVLFNFDGIQYQIGYWDGSIRRVEWVFMHEIAAIRQKEMVAKR